MLHYHGCCRGLTHLSHWTRSGEICSRHQLSIRELQNTWPVLSVVTVRKNLMGICAIIQWPSSIKNTRRRPDGFIHHKYWSEGIFIHNFDLFPCLKAVGPSIQLEDINKKRIGNGWFYQVCNITVLCQEGWSKLVHSLPMTFFNLTFNWIMNIYSNINRVGIS